MNGSKIIDMIGMRLDALRFTNKLEGLDSILLDIELLQVLRKDRMAEASEPWKDQKWTVLGFEVKPYYTPRDLISKLLEADKRGIKVLTI